MIFYGSSDGARWRFTCGVCGNRTYMRTLEGQKGAWICYRCSGWWSVRHIVLNAEYIGDDRVDASGSVEWEV